MRQMLRSLEKLTLVLIVLVAFESRNADCNYRPGKFKGFSKKNPTPIIKEVVTIKISGGIAFTKLLIKTGGAVKEILEYTEDPSDIAAVAEELLGHCK